MNQSDLVVTREKSWPQSRQAGLQKSLEEPTASKPGRKKSLKGAHRTSQDAKSRSRGTSGTNQLAKRRSRIVDRASRGAKWCQNRIAFRAKSFQVALAKAKGRTQSPLLRGKRHSIDFRALGDVQDTRFFCAWPVFRACRSNFVSTAAHRQNQTKKSPHGQPMHAKSFS